MNYNRTSALKILKNMNKVSVLWIGLILTVIHFSTTCSAQTYVRNYKRPNQYESLDSVDLRTSEDENMDSYLPDPPVIGLKPPQMGMGVVPRIDRPPIRRPPHSSRSKSRYRNNFGKGKRMRRPPGPFKVVGKRKTCTYKRKLVQGPRHTYRRSDQYNPNIVLKDSHRLGRMHHKRNLLRDVFTNNQPKNYYNNLPEPGDQTPRIQYRNDLHVRHNQPLRSDRRLHPIESALNGIDMKNYRIFIHKYTYDSDEEDIRRKKPAITPRPNWGTKTHPMKSGLTLRRRNLLDSGNSHDRKPILLPNVLPAFNQPNGPTKFSTLVWKQEPLVKEKQSSRKPPPPPPLQIVHSHLPNFDNEVKNKMYSSVFRFGDDGLVINRFQGLQAEKTQAIKHKSINSYKKHVPKTVGHGIVSRLNGSSLANTIQFNAPSTKANTGKKRPDSSPEEILVEVHRVTTTTTSTEPPQGRMGLDESPIDVIYVTPEPYPSDWLTADGVDLKKVTEAAIIVGQIVPGTTDSNARRTKVLNSAGHIFNRNNDNNVNSDNDEYSWKPIYPDPEDIHRWFNTATITPNYSEVKLPKNTGHSEVFI